MVEGIHKVDEEIISEGVEIEEMIMQAEVTCNEAWKWLIKKIGLNIML